MTWPEDGYFVSYEYDELNRLKRVWEGGVGTGVKLAEYDYDPLSRRKALRYYNGTGQVATTTSYAYEPDGDLSELNQQFFGVNPVRSYSYNAVGQVEIESGNVDVPEWSPVVPAQVGYTPNSLNQYASVGGVGFTYNGDGQLQFGGGANSYAHDVQGRLASVTQGLNVRGYQYDPLGLRLTKLQNGVPQVRYLQDGAEVIAEYDGAGTLQARYVYGPGIDQPIMMVRDGEKYFYHADRLGSVTHLTDEDGAVVEEYAYGPFGETDDPSIVGNPFRYTGREYDAETGLYYYRARYYSPTLGRFLETDPIGYYDSLNLYAYVRNDPLNLIDPTGEIVWFVPVVTGAVGAVSSGAG